MDVLAATNATLPRLDAEMLQRSPQLVEVVLYATGTNHIDLTLLSERGIALTSLPDYATTAVAEHALGMLLALAQRLHLAQ